MGVCRSNCVRISVLARNPAPARIRDGRVPRLATRRPDKGVDALFRPFQLKGLTLPNRIVMAPMTR